MANILSIKSIGIFCGSNVGNNPVYRKVAEELCDVMSAAQIKLIYGGARVGLMGIIADRILHNRGEVIGVIPQSLANVEIAHENLTELHIVNSMHERKALIAEFSDAFMLLPGGAGSLDEFFEMFTLGQLSYHTKPCGILNIDGYYDDLLKMMDGMVAKNFLKDIHRNMIMVRESPAALIEDFTYYKAPQDKKWINELLVTSL